MIWDRRSGSRVAGEWFAADGGTFTGVEGALDIAADEREEVAARQKANGVVFSIALHESQLTGESTATMRPSRRGEWRGR